MVYRRRHRLKVFAELSHGKVDRVLVTSSIKHWEAPFDEGIVSATDKEKTIKTLCKYF